MFIDLMRFLLQSLASRNFFDRWRYAFSIFNFLWACLKKSASNILPFFQSSDKVQVFVYVFHFFFKFSLRGFPGRPNPPEGRFCACACEVVMGTMSSFFTGIRCLLCISKSPRILLVSFTRSPFDLCVYCLGLVWFLCLMAYQPL